MPSATTITVPADRNGPPDSGNGGYTCGLIAHAAPSLGIASPALTVTLRKPPPLEHPIAGQRTNGQVQWAVGGILVAEAEPATLELNVPNAPTWQQVLEAKAAFDAEGFHHKHPFPTCYVCGPGRTPDDGLVLLPAPVPGMDLVAWPWHPRVELADTDGLVSTVELWSALDCPSGWVVWDYSSVHLLGRFTAQIHRRPAPAQDLIVGAWPLGRDGRKGHGASAVWTRDGELLAAATATWIAVPEAPKPPI